MIKKEIREEYYLLGLDVSTKTIGVSLLDNNGQLLELTHISPKAKPVPDSKTEELIKKADLFAEFIKKYEKMKAKIKHVVIEEPLLRSNNVNTVGTLLRFNGMVTKITYDIIGVVPEYISTYEARKNAFPELMQPGSTKKPVLFGAYPQSTDKKMVIWEKVSEREPNIKWLLDAKGALKKENFDMADSYTVALSYLKMKGLVTN
jgi:RNase H-fold protein (predicted Holliday junction resolvase)